MGARCAGIVSQQWPTATIHLNAALALTRQHNPELFLAGDFGRVVRLGNTAGA